METGLLLAIAILLPGLSAVLCYIMRRDILRKFIVAISALILFGVAIELTRLLIASGGRIAVSLEDMHIDLNWAIKGIDMLLLCYIAYLGIRLKKHIILVLSVLQAIPFLLFEVFHVFGSVKEPEFAFVIDYLSLVMILLVCIIGPVITLFAIGYMKDHEHHLALKTSRQPRFFFVLFVFLAAMNAMVMTDNLSWMYLFWEITTLCSFLLISHDGNEQAVNNASRALWINSLGGLAFICAIVLIYKAKGTLSIEEISQTRNAGEAFIGMFPIGLGLLCFAGFTKSAQFPFQSWLLGAMVAPTPVSALLHSSTMVKAGVYLVVRMAPAYSGTVLASVVAMVGGFTFLAASAIAISQRNGKRVLAYSTIANLGLIICCAGMGSYAAIGAAVLLMIFHAVSKGLLFLCIGTIENGIGSRDIEDMQGLMKKMPFTTVITVIGMISMLLPPFGVLITKWLAIESSVNSPLVLLAIILGSAFTVVFWSKWIGIILTMSYKPKYIVERLSLWVRGSLVILISAVLAASILIVPMFNSFIKPYLTTLNISGGPELEGRGLGVIMHSADASVIGGFTSILFFAIVLVLMITIPYFLRKTKAESVKPPYLCGENMNNDVRGLEFISPGEKVEEVVVHNYYMAGFFGEKNLTLWTNLVAAAIIIIMFGVVVK